MKTPKTYYGMAVLHLSLAMNKQLKKPFTEKQEELLHDFAKELRRIDQFSKYYRQYGGKM